jgi:hypothetical protein
VSDIPFSLELHAFSAELVPWCVFLALVMGNGYPFVSCCSVSLSYLDATTRSVCLAAALANCQLRGVR